MNFCILTLRFLLFDYTYVCFALFFFPQIFYSNSENIFLVMKFFLDFSPALVIYVYTVAPV